MPYVEVDGARLYYEERGEGSPTLVFIHGWCCDHTFFAPQLEHFAHDHRVVAVDLRGCGRSDRPGGGYDMRTFADDVAGVCRHLALVEPILIGHSMGGGIAVELAARHPSLPAAVIAVDPGPLDALPRAKSIFAGFADRMEGPDGESVRRAWVDPGPIDPDIRHKVIDTMCSVPLEIAVASLRGTTTEWNGAAALALCHAPLMVIVARFGGSNDPHRLLRLKPTATVGVTVGVGHFHQLEDPDQINAMIDRFMRRVLA
jgi:pimeloyl-ACP methyl ester carboxylesterase